MILLSPAKVKIYLVCICIFFIGGCEKRVQENSELQSQLDEMQAEIRLLVKEVVNLNTKLDSALAKNGVGKVDVLVPEVLFPDDANFLGNPDAEFAIVEFMDFQCPYCVRYAKQVLPALKKRYIDSGKVKYVIRDYPLEFHRQAKGAAIAAKCAGSQSKYWEMHGELISNSRGLGKELYSSLAEKLNLNVIQFEGCLQSPVMAEAVEEDLIYGTEVGTRGTPNFYIGRIVNGKLVDAVNISGARSVEAFDRAIQQVLRKG